MTKPKANRSRRITDRLSVPAWQGIGAIFTVLGTLVAVVALWIGLEQRGPSDTGTRAQIITPALPTWSAGASAVATSEPSPSATASPSPTPTLTPAPTSTPTPSPSPTDSPTPTPVPTRTPLPREPINAETAARVAPFEPPLETQAGPVSALAYADDGLLYATGFNRATSRMWLWQVDPRTTPTVLDEQTYERAGFAFSRDGYQLAWSIRDGTEVAVWDTHDVEAPSIFRPWDAADQRFKGAKILSLAFTPAGDALASGTNQSAIALAGLSEGRGTSALFYAPDAYVEVVSLAFGSTEPGDLWLASIRGWQVTVWKLDPATLEGVFPVDLTPVPQVATRPLDVFNLVFSPDGEMLGAVGQPLGGVQLWSTEGWGAAKWFAGGADNSAIERPFVPGATSTRSIVSYPDGVPRGDNIEFSRDGSVVAGWIKDIARMSEATTHRVRLWRTLDGEILANVEPVSGAITSLAFSPDGATLAAGTVDGKIYKWRVR